MKLRHRLMAALFGAALVMAGTVAGVVATYSAPSGSDPGVVLAMTVHPHGCGGCGNGGA
ncbi:hypothetical protein [Polymorphospora rubra]|uniref:hypothetical protein n=1 Tax=Polymorphospora rubra TaxID=338584 RepID=UPI0033FB4A17